MINHVQRVKNNLDLIHAAVSIDLVLQLYAIARQEWRELGIIVFDKHFQLEYGLPTSGKFQWYLACTGLPALVCTTSPLEEIRRKEAMNNAANRFCVVVHNPNFTIRSMTYICNCRYFLDQWTIVVHDMENNFDGLLHKGYLPASEQSRSRMFIPPRAQGQNWNYQPFQEKYCPPLFLIGPSSNSKNAC
jgi:hypothetical protein